MKQLHALAAALSLVTSSAALGQWLETTIPVPDSLSGLARPQWVFCDTVSNTVLVSGTWEPCLIVIDGASGNKVARLAGEARAFCAGPGKVYSARFGAYPGFDSVVLVIDPATRRVRDSVVVGWGPTATCYSPELDRVYCANRFTNDVSVIDAGPDSVIATVRVGEDPTALCWNPPGNKLYCLCYYSRAITVIDAATNTVRRTLACGREPVSLCLNPAENRLYCANRGSRTITVIDATLDSVVGTIPVPGVPTELCVNPRDNKVYCSTQDSTVLVFDGRNDSLVFWLPSSGTPVGLWYNSRNNRLYYASPYSGTVFVVDGTTNHIAGIIRVGPYPRALAANPGTGTLYVSSEYEGTVSVCDLASNRERKRILLAARPVGLGYNWRDNKVYCGLEPAAVSVVDGRTNAVLSTFRTPVPLALLCYNSLSNKVYGADRDGAPVLVVGDCAGDSVCAVIPLEDQPTSLCHNFVSNKLYCATYDMLYVIDGRGDTVRAVPEDVSEVTTMVYEAKGNKIYCLSDDDDEAWVVDGAGDTVIRELEFDDCATAACHDFNHDKLFVGGWDVRITVLDCRNDSVRTLIETELEGFSALCFYPVNNRVYCASWEEEELAVLDAGGDSVLRYVELGAEDVRQMELDITNNKLYCLSAYDGIVTVVDCTHDSVIQTYELPDEAAGIAWNPFQGRMYVADPYGSRIWVLRDSGTVGTRDDFRHQAPGTRPQPTIVRGVLYLSPSPFPLPVEEGSGVRGRAVLLDIAGRRVMTLHPGANDVRHLAPGVYFTCGHGPGARGAQGSSRKVVLTR